MAANLKDMDLEGIDLENVNPENVKMARQKLLEMLNSDDLTDDVKENLKALLGGDLPLTGNVDSVTGILIALGFASLIFSVIFFFGYKLYKSLKEKETKREEKKKAKQAKKKK